MSIYNDYNITMTDEEKFIKLFDEAKVLAFPFTKEFFRNQFFKNDSSLNDIINNAILKKIDFIPTFFSIADEIHQEKISLTKRAFKCYAVVYLIIKIKN